MEEGDDLLAAVWYLSIVAAFSLFEAVRRLLPRRSAR